MAGTVAVIDTHLEIFIAIGENLKRETYPILFSFGLLFRSG